MHAYMGREEKEESGRGGSGVERLPLISVSCTYPQKEGRIEERHEPEGGVMLS